MNGSGSFNLSGHLLMSLGVSVVLGGGRGTIRKISSAAPLQAPLLRSQRGLAAFWGPLSQRLRTRVRLPNCWYSDSSFLHTLIQRLPTWECIPFKPPNPDNIEDTKKADRNLM